MKKEKIAISIDKPMLEMVDAMVDGLLVRSRSQAIEQLIAKGIEQQYVRDAVILVRGDHAGAMLRQVEHKPLLSQHLDWLRQHGVQHVYLVTGPTQHLDEVKRLCEGRAPLVTIVMDEKQQGTVPALGLLRKELQRNFILILGDTLNRFDLTKMIIYHLQHDRIATIGLISTPNPRPYSRVDMEGDRIIEFRNKDSTSHVFDAGIYIFKPVIFKHLGGRLLDSDVFPKLCRTNDIKGYFTYGKYLNLGDP